MMRWIASSSGASIKENGMTKSIERDAYLASQGQEIGISQWHLIDQKRIDAFADTTGDHQFIHIDPERAARETPFGGTIAHGFLTVSMLSALAYEALPSIQGTAMSVNYGFDKLRFIAPVRSGARIRASFVLAEAKMRGPNELLSRNNVTVEIEGNDKPALVAEWLSLVYFA